MMQISHSIQALFFFFFAVAVHARPGVGSIEEKRAACNADNVLRALRRTASSDASEATSLCYSLILYGVPTVTVVPPPGATPAVVTSTSTITRSVYPNGVTLEELHFPTFVSSYPASRVSSACSCLLGPKTTDTVTATGPTITQTTIITSLSTLTGPCATNIPYVGVSTIQNYNDRSGYKEAFHSDPVSLSNAYQCCNTCLNYPGGTCVAYFNIPGTSCNYLTANIPYQQTCASEVDDALVVLDSAHYPNQLGGRGPCADTIVVTGS